MALKKGLKVLLLSVVGIRVGIALSVKELLSVDDVSGVIGVRGGGGLLEGEGLRRIPCAICVIHLASNLLLDLDPGGLPTVNIQKTNSILFIFLINISTYNR